MLDGVGIRHSLGDLAWTVPASALIKRDAMMFPGNKGSAPH
jgi:hypothetical protein